MDRVDTSATWANSDLAWPGLRWTLVRFTFIDDGSDCDHDDDHKKHGFRQSDENMLVMRLTSLIFEITNGNGNSGTRARLFWLRLKISVPPCSHILAKGTFISGRVKLAGYGIHKGWKESRNLAERASTWKGVR